MRAPLVIPLVALLSTALVPLPTSASAGCDDALARLDAAHGASPDVWTDALAEAVGAAMEACGPTTDETSAEIGARPGEFKASTSTGLRCSPSSIQGIGPLEVLVVAPPFAPPQRYQTEAVITYTLHASGYEALTARDPTLTGFDATSTYGKIYLAGVPFDAHDWFVSASCDALGGAVCDAAGYAAFASATVEIYLRAELLLCL